MTIRQLSKVPRLGEKAFEQAAGFLRITNGSNPLDNTGVHPESYHIVKQMAKNAGRPLDKFIADPMIRNQVKLEEYLSDVVGLPTLTDIMKELEKPGHDPRGAATSFSFAENLKSINDVIEGMIVPGVVTNLTNFGAFVDIGVKQDGLLHISQITTKFIQNPSEVLSLAQHLSVKVIAVDILRKRINLSLLF